MPRSGTTWLARLLATAPRTALPGREPMNPRGRQYALGGSLPGWVAVEDWTRSQQRALKLAYAGCNPWTYSRYGRHQWTAPLPSTRVIVKDPFAMLSIPAVTAATGAIAVLVYRHPAAALASYRRMGWQPDLDELRPIVSSRGRVCTSTALSDGWGTGTVGQGAPAMGLFWSALYDIALEGLEGSPDAVIVSHEELAGGGVAAARVLFRRLGLELGKATFAELNQQQGEGTSTSHGLHNFARSPAATAQAWRKHISVPDLRTIEEVTETTRQRLEALRLRLAD